MKEYLIATLLFAIFSSCSSKKDTIVDILKEWNGKEIFYPQNNMFTIMGKDTISQYPSNHFQYTIINYVGSDECMNCRLQLPMWKVFIKQLEEKVPFKVPILFYFCPKNQDELINILKRDRFNYPVCIDTNDTFNKLNKLPSNPIFQTFLLDDKKHIIAVGNPIENPSIKELYLNIIRGESVNTSNAQQASYTKVEIDRMLINMGYFDWQKEQQSYFTLKNIGDKLLVIGNVNTSCGCTTVDFSHEPVPPGGTLQLSVTYKADKPEHFHKTITVYCNTEDSPLRLKINGDAKQMEKTEKRNL